MTKHIHPCGFCGVIECDGDCPEAKKDAAMTREDRAIDLLRDHIPPAAKLLQIGSPGGECWILEVVLAFADAEAAAMRERAAGVASDTRRQMEDSMRQRGISSDTLVGIVSMAQVADTIAAAIRALPATGEVGRG